VYGILHKNYENQYKLYDTKENAFLISSQMKGKTSKASKTRKSFTSRSSVSAKLVSSSVRRDCHINLLFSSGSRFESEEPLIFKGFCRLFYYVVSAENTIISVYYTGKGSNLLLNSIILPCWCCESDFSFCDPILFASSFQCVR